MAFKDAGKAPVDQEVAIHRIRITLTSRNVKSLRRQQVLALRKAQLQQQLLDLRTASGFTRDLVARGPDLHLLQAQGLALTRLKELNQGAPRAADQNNPAGIQFSPWEEAGLCQGYQMQGVLQVKAADPGKCEARGAGLQSVCQGQPASFTFFCRTASGDPVLGGQPPSVTIVHKDTDRSLHPSIQDNQDGTFHISYLAPEPGELSISVSLRGQHTPGSPFSVKVRGKSQRHPGIYHCCTFCSSGGQKEARCGCGGTMPGGYQGCGHGHKGHPGQSHWSCCGATKEKSECLGVSSSAPRNLLRTVAL